MHINPYKQPIVKLKKLMNQYKTHGNIIVGVDFDFTLYDSINNKFYDDILNLVLKAQTSTACTICLWTANKNVNTVIDLCTAAGVHWDYINESPLVFSNPPSRKAHFNILLDDSAGLTESCFVLEEFIRQTERTH